MSYVISEQLNDFLDHLLEESHGVLDAGLKTEMKKDLYGRLQNHLLSSFVQALPSEKDEAFVEFMNGAPDETAIQEFFMNNIPQVNEVVAAALLEFRDVYMGAGNTQG